MLGKDSTGGCLCFGPGSCVFGCMAIYRCSETVLCYAFANFRPASVMCNFPHIIKWQHEDTVPQPSWKQIATYDTQICVLKKRNVCHVIWHSGVLSLVPCHWCLVIHWNAHVDAHTHTQRQLLQLTTYGFNGSHQRLLKTSIAHSCLLPLSNTLQQDCQNMTS